MVTPADKPIILLGFMSSGKSTLGKQLAVLLSWDFIDLDRFIEATENRSIPEIFKQDGEAAFRKIESIALEKVLTYSCQVIAIGGGAPCLPENLQLIKEKSLSVYLKTSEAQLAVRLTYSNTPRPLLNGKSESETQTLIADLLAAREPFYCQADIIIESDAITAEMILQTINLP